MNGPTWPVARPRSTTANRLAVVRRLIAADPLGHVSKLARRRRWPDRCMIGFVVATLVLVGCAESTPESADTAAADAPETSQQEEGSLDLDTRTSVIADQTVEAAPVAGDHFVGEVTEQLWIGVAIDGNDVTVYLCDDDRGVWLRGELVDGRAELTDADASVDLELTAAGVAGTVTLGDVATNEVFEAEASSGDDGLYRAEVTVEQVDYVGGWIVILASQVGAVAF